jgi:hypothetical protein
MDNENWSFLSASNSDDLTWQTWGASTRHKTAKKFNDSYPKCK